jgi:hypothetical protein
MADKMHWTTGNLMWVAGVLLGEGCFSPHIRRSGDREGEVQLRILCSMTDKDIIFLLREITGSGSVRGPVVHKALKLNGEQRLPLWSWEVRKQLDVYELDIALSPYLGEHKRRDIEKAFELRREFEQVATGRNIVRIFSGERSSVLPPAVSFLV